MSTRALFLATLLFGLALAALPSGTLAQTAPDPTQTPTVLPTDTPVPAASETPATTQTTPVATDTPVATQAAVPTPFVSTVPCATDDPSNERVQRSDRRGDDEDGRGDPDEFRTGNGRNSVVVHNCTSNRLRVRASIQLNTIPGHVVKPLNQAYAEGSCTSCDTLAVALQIDLYSSARADDIEPQNYAIALNTGCTGCVTVARAVQYAQGEDDPRDVSRDISDDVDALSDELQAIQSDPNATLADAETRLNSVLARFNALGGQLGEQRDERDD